MVYNAHHQTYPPTLIMAESKTYLKVPFAQKDAAKALGAKWDAVNKKWYVPAGKDTTLFAKWQTEVLASELPTTPMTKPRARATVSQNNASANNGGQGVITHAADKDFVAYNGDEPPWN